MSQCTQMRWVLLSVFPNSDRASKGVRCVNNLVIEMLTLGYKARRYRVGHDPMRYLRRNHNHETHYFLSCFLQQFYQVAIVQLAR